MLSILALLLFRKQSPGSAGSLSLSEVLERVDPLGTALSIPGLILLIYSLTSGNIVGWSNGGVIGTLVAAVVLLAAFVFVEAKISRYPFVPGHLWNTTDLPSACALAAITYAVWQGANYFLALQLQGKHKFAIFSLIVLIPGMINPPDRLMVADWHLSSLFTQILALARLTLQSTSSHSA